MNIWLDRFNLTACKVHNVVSYIVCRLLLLLSRAALCHWVCMWIPLLSLTT